MMADLSTLALIAASVATVVSLVATATALRIARRVKMSLEAKNRQLPPSPDTTETDAPLSTDADEPDR